MYEIELEQKSLHEKTNVKFYILLLAGEIDEGTENDGTNIWEYSGLEEGDMLIEDKDDEEEGHYRNGLRDRSRYWPKATVPYFINKIFGKYSNFSIRQTTKGVQCVNK